MRRIAAILPAFLAMTLGLSAGPISEYEITSDPVQDGMLTFDVRFTPGETHDYDKLTFDCVLHQEFPKTTTDRQSGVQVNEPAVFTYRRRDIRMVEELDVHIAFKVPVSVERLKEIFGLTAFNAKYPVTVPRIAVTAEIGGKKAWSMVCETTGVHKPDAAPQPEPARKAETP
jgi:hypothetical protein